MAASVCAAWVNIRCQAEPHAGAKFVQKSIESRKARGYQRVAEFHLLYDYCASDGNSGVGAAQKAMNIYDVQDCENNDPFRLSGSQLKVESQRTYGKRIEKARAMRAFFRSFICNGRTRAQTSVKMPISIIESTAVMSSQRSSYKDRQLSPRYWNQDDWPDARRIHWLLSCGMESNLA